MTCDETRTLVEGSIGRGGPAALSRGERCAALGHLLRCPPCAAWIRALQRGRPVSSRTQDEAAALFFADLQDPEYDPFGGLRP